MAENEIKFSEGWVKYFKINFKVIILKFSPVF